VIDDEIQCSDSLNNTHKNYLYRILSNFRSCSDNTADERTRPRDASVAATSISTSSNVTSTTQLLTQKMPN